ncbi:MAG: DUF3667 domain-containing protein [Bacteroidota bacterium]
MEENKTPPIADCLNCGHPLAPSDQFCPHCGQRRTTGRIRLRQLLSDFVDNFFNLDSRTFRSIRALFWPGFLTSEYFRGRHRNYIHPLRIFLLSTVLLVATLSWWLGDEISLDVNPSEELMQDQTERELALAVDSLRQQYGAADSLSVAIDQWTAAYIEEGRGAPDSIDLNSVMQIYGEVSATVAVDDLLHQPLEDLLRDYRIEGFRNRLLFSQKVKLFRNTRGFISYLIGRITWFVLILMPLLALVLYLLYIRRGFYYVEHFIFSTHVHSAIFILLSLLLGLSGWLTEEVIPIVLLLMATYWLLATKAFYGQGWGKTLLKSSLLFFFFYWIIVSIALVVAILLGVLFF